jgi:hypothetical protein
VISRRQLLLGSAGALALGCEGKKMAPTISTPPWHLWGTEASINIPNVSDGTIFQQSQQLARVSYARPETWSFLFVAQLLKVPTPSAGNIVVIVEYELNVGVGRAVGTIPASDNGQNVGFCRFVWVFAAAPVYPTQVKWTTKVRTPVLDEGAAVPQQESIDGIPAQDIQCNCKATVAAAAAPIGDTDTQLIVKAFFAPKTHVRPEWLGTAAGTRTPGSGIPRFNGGEDKGS